MQNITVADSAHPQHKDITLLSVKGFIDTNTAPEFEKTFQKVLADNKFNLIIDLREVNYISSAGWGIFVGEIRRIRSQKGNLFLVGMSPEVTEAYELLEFETILKSFPNVELAVQKGFGKSKTGKSSEKSKVESVVVEKPQMAKSVESQGVEKRPEGSLTSYETPKKSNWLARLFKWKLF
jgi:anti-sigma B factor antagonist